jgi:DNA-binding response OmpR family regulator
MARKKILIVDDDNSLVELCMIVLGAAGYEVRGAYNGPQALTMLQKELPDLILLDVMMPGMSGIEVCRQVRAEYDGSPQIVMYTADGRDATYHRSLEAGANDVLNKEVPIYEIVSRITRCLYPTAPLG